MDPFIGEIRIFGGNFAPEGWALCNGQLLDIVDNTALFSLLGTNFGGNGRTTFGVPDLRGRVPIGTGQGPGLTNRFLSQFSGWEEIQLLSPQLPAHSHTITNTTTSSTSGLIVSGSGTIKCSNESGNTQDPTNAFPAKTKGVGGDKVYTNDATQATNTMHANAVEINASVQGQVDVTVNSVCELAGNSHTHENMQPWLGMNFIIALVGIYPSRS